jgi:hypothetical protein
MKLCYCDETGIGNEPIAVMVGVVVDSQRMHITKEDWDDLLKHLSGIVGVRLDELHTRDFYSGNSPFRGIAGPKRSEYISTIFQWFADRKHHFIHTAIDKNAFQSAVRMGVVPPEIRTVWRCMGAHIILAAQRAFQKIEKTKGHTIFIFDNEHREEKHFKEFIFQPPGWSDSYYERGKKQRAFEHVIDVPYFADSKDVALLQLADFTAYFLRRYAEIEERHSAPRYPDEYPKVKNWISLLASRSIGLNCIYPCKGRDKTADFAAIRELNKRPATCFQIAGLHF